ncbi:probable tyrosine-protein kinase DDB_G0283397 [Folsomia candida]|uniref:Cyclin-dependent kinase 4 n=1 Tax=Folsomia candida TaxID=158441 RepID=A0A226DVV6_FOLCA|nr:probable tyrosine-protein kinase DDB_G0283397 [Folsomia candida]OXA49592.1 Cyclin-dependent kinase 4 [Folsomia candida]
MELGPYVPLESTNCTLESFLGCGSFGYVFQAVNERGKVSAVKIIFFETSGKTLEEQEAEKLRLSREYKLMAGKKHDNLVEILKSTHKPFTVEDIQALLDIPCIQDRDDVRATLRFRSFQAEERKQIPTLCIQMELCGKTLRHWLNINNEIDNPNLRSVRRNIVKDMYNGLKYLHLNKIIHRDFRPENIMFSFSSTGGEEFAFPIKLGDFGLCRKVHSEHTVTDTLTPFVGSVTYRAPETNFTDYSIPADLYSFGLVSWEILQIIKQKDTRSMFHRLVHDSQKHLVIEADWWFPRWAELIIKLTKRRVQDRIQVCDEILLMDAIKSEVTVESHKQLSAIQDSLVPGYIVNINIKDDTSKFYYFKVDNVTYNGVNSTSLQHLRLEIGGNSCTIKNLTLESLRIQSNNCIVSNVICDQVDVDGDGNQLSNVETLHMGEAVGNSGFGISIWGENNTLESFKCCNTLAKVIEIHVRSILRQSVDWEAFAQRFGPVCIYFSKSSDSCTIKNANIRNAFISGTRHGLLDIECNNVIQINGLDHSIKSSDAVNLIDNSKRSLIRLDLCKK